MDELDRKMALKSLFDSQGFKLFKEELDGLIDSNEIKRDHLSKESSDGETLNFINGNKCGLQSVVYVLDGFREELEEIAGER